MKNNDIYSYDYLCKQASAFGVTLESGDISVLSLPLKVNNSIIPNRLFIQPVECADAEINGAPGELTERRYLRFAAGGAGCIWMEAVALNSELKSNPRQLVLSEKTLGSFRNLINNMKEKAFIENGTCPIVIIQISHPGRSCNPIPKPATKNAVWDRLKPSYGQDPLSDDEIARLAESYGHITRLANKAGFDGVEIKSCHMFFISELLSARNRPGRYGGCFENRTRHLKEAMASSQAEAGNMFLTVRLNAYDGIPYPEGFGMDENGGFLPDITEPARLISELNNEFGVELINCSSGDPRYDLFPDITNSEPLFSPPPHPIKSGARMHSFAADIKSAVKDIKVAATGFSHLYQYAPAIGARMIEQNQADMIGFGRQALAYPDFARDILLQGKMSAEKICLCCGGCSRLLSAGKYAGCIVRDSEYR